MNFGPFLPGTEALISLREAQELVGRASFGGEQKAWDKRGKEENLRIEKAGSRHTWFIFISISAEKP